MAIQELDADILDLIDDQLKRVAEWDKNGETNTFIFYSEPIFVNNIKKALIGKYAVSVQYATYYGWTQAEITVQKLTNGG